MGKAIRNTKPADTTDVADDVAQSLGLNKKTPEGPKQNQPSPAKQKPADVSDAVGQSLGLKKKDGGNDGSGESSPTISALPSLEDASIAFQNKTATGKDVDVLSQTDQGIKMGLNILSPEAKDIYATAHNGPKKSDMVTSVTELINQYYPESQDPKQNHQRGQILQSVWSGDQTAITNLKEGILGGLQKKINDRASELQQQYGNLYVRGGGAAQIKRQQINDDHTISQLKQQQEQTRRTIDEYGKMAMTSSKDMEAWLNLDKQHPNIQTSIAAEKLGRMIEEKYGADRTSPNREYDRMRTGFEHIIKGLQMDVNEYLAYGIPTKNPELMKKAQDKLQTLARYQQLYDKLDTEQFPDVGLDKTARFLGDIIADKHPNKLIRTKEDVREAGRIANEQNPGFLDKYGKFVDVAAEKQGQGTFIPRGGGGLNEVIGGLVSSSAKSAADLLKWRANVFGYDKDKEEISGKEASPGMKGTTQSRTEPTKITYDKEGKAYRELPNENYGTLPWNNFYRFAGENIPGLLEFIASEGMTKAGASLVTGGKMGKAAQQLTGLIGASYLTSYNSNREFADANIDDKTSMGEAKKIVAANFLTLANAGVFHLLNASPSKMVESAISKNVMPEVIDLLEKNNWEKLSAKATEGFMKENLLPRIKAVVSKFAESAGSGAKMGSAAVIDQRLKDFVGLISNNNYTPSTIEDNARAFVQQGITMAALGIPGMIRTGLVPHSTREALHQAGLYAPQYIDMINERMNNGELDPHQAAGMVSIIKTMNEELINAATEHNDDGTPLTTRQQRDIAIANFRKRAAAAMDENGQEVKNSTEPDKEIKEIKKENNWQSIEDTPTFKSIAPVEESGEKGEKVKSMSDIDPVKQYTYQKEGVEVTESGADLINHLETGDIYEREKTSGDEDKVGETKKTPDAEGEDQKPAEDQEKTPLGEYKPNIRDDYFAKADFFSPEEKTKFEALDDAGKDKMIDDKRAELASQKESIAADVVNDAVKEGKIADNLVEHVQKDPEQFLSDVADQALGYTREEGNRVKSPYGGTEASVREKYGDKVVDAALRMHPEEGINEPGKPKYEFVDIKEARRFETPDAYLQHLEKSGVIKIECD